MKINMRHMLSACVLLVTGLSSCSDDSMDGYLQNEPGDGIRFTASSAASSRTIYDDENIFQINWESQDNITIYSDKGHLNLKQANYKVTPSLANEKEGTIDALNKQEQLRWANYDVHKFVGVYPQQKEGNPKIKVDATNGIVTFPINRNQIIKKKIRIADEKTSYYGKKYGAYTYYCQPDMNNAYMTAHNELAPGEVTKDKEGVFLRFTPVMTTLEVVVKGKSVPVVGSQESNSTPMVISGVSISRELPKSNQSYDRFQWNAIKNELVTDNKQISPVANNQTFTEQTMLSFPVNEELTLTEQDSAVFTFFLPPYAIESNSPIKIRVHTLGVGNYQTKVINGPVAASHKRRVSLPKYPTKNITNNNWITPLDDNIYVNQLSIPGSHDSATGDGTKFDVGGFKWGVSQGYSVNDQLKMGIRAFDLHVSHLKNNGLWIFHDWFKMERSWDELMMTFKTYLSDPLNKDEFVIVFFNHESDPDHPIDDNTDLTTNENANEDKYWAEAMLQSLTDIRKEINPSTGESYVVDFKPDLTIGECRGKILFLCRSNNKYTTDNSKICGGYFDWNDSRTGGNGKIYGPEGTDSEATLYYQNFAEPKGLAVDEKYLPIKEKLILNYLNISRTFHTNSVTMNPWCVNHTSGKIKVWSIFDDFETVRVAENAAHQNKFMYEELSSNLKPGSTGIVFIDWLGSDYINKSFIHNYHVYGARLPQAIINNNYKYRMRKSGDAVTNN